MLPTAPRFHFVYEARVQMGERRLVGTYGGSERGTTQLLGGSFEGPKMRGTILPSTRDWPIYLKSGVRTTDVSSVFVTDDGVHLFITVRGFRYDLSKMKGLALEAEQVEPAPNPHRVAVQIEAPDDSGYEWLNNNIYVGVGGKAGADAVATLRVYRVL